MLETVWRDTVYALRIMRQKPAYTATAIITLALAIGGNTAMFTVIRAVLLKPLQYRQSDRLVSLAGGATPTRFREMQANTRSFTGLGAFTGQEDMTLSGGADPEVLKGVRVSANFLAILAVEPIRGRSFRAAEDAPGGAPVAMIGYDLWKRRFAGDPSIVGKTVTLDAAPAIVIGILPPGFRFPFSGIEVWMTAPAESPRIPPKSRTLSPFLNVFGRLAPGVTLAQANAELQVARRQYATAHPAMLDAKPRPVEATRMQDELVADVRSMLWMLFGAVGLVLLIACANVASLLLARAAAREREIAVRSALGAARSRLIRQLLAESVVLSICGGILGVVVAAWSLRAIPAITSFDLPRAGEIHLDWTVLAFAAALSLGTGVLFGLAPSLAASRPDLMGVLRSSGESARLGNPASILRGLNLRGLLLMGQVALCTVLLIGVALLVESVSRLRGVDVGFDPSNVLTMRLSLPPSRYDTNQKRAAFFQELVQRVGSAPGVRAASAAMTLPMTGYAGSPVQDAAKPLLKLNERLIAQFNDVTPGYFGALRIPLRRGRDFSEQDTETAPRVAIIGEALARKFWPDYPRGQDPVGRHIWVGGISPKPAEIIGIAAEVHQNLENSAWPETVYVCFAQNPQPFAMLAVRTESGPLRFTNTVREQIRRLDQDQGLSDVRRMDDLVDEQVGQRRLLAILLGIFAGVALLLALVGIYGVIAYSVAQRTRELGIRRALGAQQGDILRLVLLQGFRLAVAGVGLGIVGAYSLTRLLTAMLFHVSPTDPATFTGIAALFLLVALAASYLPARRATRIDPMTALRV